MPTVAELCTNVTTRQSSLTDKERKEVGKADTRRGKVKPNRNGRNDERIDPP
jgi:hypothetical protein